MFPKADRGGQAYVQGIDLVWDASAKAWRPTFTHVLSPTRQREKELRRRFGLSGRQLVKFRKEMRRAEEHFARTHPRALEGIVNEQAPT